MNFEDLSFWDKQEITNSLAAALGSFASGMSSKGSPLAHAPVERAQADAALAYEKGFAEKVDGNWVIHLDDYLDFRGKS